MEQEKFHIDDDSGDKDFFTIIPNYILNHSTSVDQALYSQLKRLAGDKKFCYPSFKYLMKQLGIGKEKLRKSFKYLITHKWISDIGKKQVLTKGGYQWVNCYQIKNIWKLNTDYYKGGSGKAPLKTKGGLEQSEGGSGIDKGGSGYTAIRRTIKEDIRKKIIPKGIKENLSNKEINYLIKFFKEQFNLKVLDGTIKENRQYCWLSIKKFKCDGVKLIIKVGAEDDFWKNKLTSFKTLYYKGVAIASKIKSDPLITSI